MFAPGPRAVGFTIVWPEGVIFRSMMTYHVQFLLLVLAGWVNRQQQDVIDYLQEENRVLRAGLRGKRLSLSDDDRRRLAVKAQALGGVVAPLWLRAKCASCGGRGMFDHEVSQAQPVQAREAEEVPRSQLGGIQRRAAPPRRFDGLV